MQSILMIVVALIVCLTASATTIWEISPVNGHLYAAIDCLSWLDAESQAANMGGHLATIRNEEENEWAKSSFGQFDFMWIGLHEYDYFQDPRTWVWVSDEPVTYTNWAVGEPSGPFGEPFVAIEGDNDYFNLHYGEWCDLSSQYEPWQRKHIGLVEITNDVPEPSTLLVFGAGLVGLFLLRRRRRMT